MQYTKQKMIYDQLLEIYSLTNLLHFKNRNWIRNLRLVFDVIAFSRIHPTNIGLFVIPNN